VWKKREAAEVRGGEFTVPAKNESTCEKSAEVGGGGGVGGRCVRAHISLAGKVGRSSTSIRGKGKRGLLVPRQPIST